MTIGTGLSSLPSSTFQGCSSLSSVTLGTNITSIGNSAFSGCTSLGAITIPNAVTSIGSSAFSGCSSLITATIGSNVHSLGSYAFNNCTQLKKLCFLGNAPTVDSTVFLNDTALTIYFAAGNFGWGTSLAGIPTWNPTMQASGKFFGVLTNKFGFNITGNSNLVVVVQVCTNLINPVWSSISTNKLINGSSYFGDSNWTKSKVKFYRLSSQ